MKALRRILGIVVMIAGLLGLLLSLAGLVGVWVAKPSAATIATSTLDTLNASITTSQSVMEITSQALGATIDSVDALSSMLEATANTVGDTKPVLNQVTSFMGGNLVDTMESASTSLKTAQQAAAVLDSTIKSLDNFRVVLSSVPLIGSFVVPPDEPYNPEKPLAESLGEVATNLESLPAMFTDMSENLAKSTENLDTIQKDLSTMSGSVALISQSLSDYQKMIAQSQSSMDNLKDMVTNVQANLNNILTWTALGLSLFLLWLLVAQIVILSQGWELYQGSAGRTGKRGSLPPAPEPAPEPTVETVR